MDKQENNMKGNPLPGGSSPFRIPEGYFEALPGRIHERIAEIRTPSRTVFLIPARLAYAAMIAVLVAVGYLGLRNLTGIIPGNTLSAKEINYVIENYGYEFDDEMLISAFIETDTEYYTDFSDTETEQILEYLSEDYIDFSELIDEN